MLILPISRFNVDRYLQYAIKAGLWMLGAVVTGSVLFYFLGTGTSAGERQEGSFAINQKPDAVYPYEAIGMGGLTINPRLALGWVSRIADDLVLVAYNCRPDVPSRDVSLLLNFKVSKEQLILQNGKTLFLKEMDQGKGLSVSNEETGLWVKPILLDNGTVLVESGRKLAEDGEERGQFYLTAQGGVSPAYNPSYEPFMAELKEAQFYGQDLLIQKYGGNEYSAWRDKGVLELTAGSQTYACFVSPGDYLYHDGREWKVVALEELPAGSPAAQVKAFSFQGIEIEAWDDKGFYPVHLKLAESDRGGRFHLKPESVPSKARMRNAAQVSCALGKRRMILRQGDWLLKTATGWRNLRRIDEIERYLEHRLKGELFIFDGIENEQGRFLMTGNFFDETRTHLQSVSVPIEGEKSSGKGNKKKNARKVG